MTDTQADVAALNQSMRQRTEGAGLVTEEALARFVGRQGDLGGKLIALRFDPAARKAGMSSGTNLFETDIRGGDGALRRRRFVFRYDLGGAFFYQYDLVAQFRIMRSLNRAGFPAPVALWLDAAGEVAGRPGLVMERIEAAAPSSAPFVEGPLMDASAAERREMLLGIMRLIGRLHALPVEELGLDILKTRGDGPHFIDREIDWITKELLHAVPSSADGERRAFYEEVRGTLLGVRDRLVRLAPRQRAPELTHGDPMVTNVMFAGTDIAALLDWELCHLGIGEQDVFYHLGGIAFWTLHLPPVAGIPSEDEMVAAYTAARGKFADADYARLLAEWRMASMTAMAHRRLPPELRHLEETYWDNCRKRLAACA